ncbi:exopolysaccharide biosynthesis polyprenyl glycosylphosphotransferase [Myroides guanonis]|uniref:Putative colanic acid biosysnthesis UDP-glucose lipid carrier transferase n=1 Tax=Myroides guanonis TaxID=1150112 RepID=A0A1I3RN14_9FLAO|nr:exopolysaccharide biosynthesis polyprenyl glycosylphosphotransferase [Myroides guanonis]SFJ46691.1 putative colanic acid biosysnthesis UDP-glucose lipid carrier transferase [Myroides guanonis]
MLPSKQGRFSKYLRPITIVADLLVINTVASLVFPNFSGKIVFLIFATITWLFVAWASEFYDVYRHTGIYKILEKIFKQFVSIFVLVIAYNGFFPRFAEKEDFILFGIMILSSITFLKLSIYFSLIYFREKHGGNFRNVILIGDSSEIRSLEQLFQEKTKFGYRCLKVFDSLDNVDEIEAFITEKNIDEIYLSYSYIDKKNVNQLLTFSDNNLVLLKYVPTRKELLNINSKADYYDVIPIIPRRKIPLDKTYNKFLKRIFDIVFSIVVIVCIMSWLVPLLAILIKLESKGPVLFKQKRTGLNDTEFTCYKFRSMRINEDSHLKQATRSDDRITKIGKFIRRTSLDEFPQFINVFLGNMSIVGPRPHMIKHTELYSKKVNRFMLRHLVKPGITGMAQTHGYRGEIESDRDLINRFKYDLFYLENWSIALDLKIIYLTIYNVFKGDEKAY